MRRDAPPVWIIPHLGHKQPPIFVEGHRHRRGDEWFGRHQLDAETFFKLKPSQRVGCSRAGNAVRVIRLSRHGIKAIEQWEKPRESKTSKIVHSHALREYKPGMGKVKRETRET